MNVATTSGVPSDSWARLAFDVAPAAMILVDPAGAIALVNQAADRLFDYPRHELIGQPIERLIAGGLHAQDTELIGRSHSGRELSIEVRMTPIYLDDGSLTLISIIEAADRQSTERRSAERLRREMAALVESAEDAIITKDLDGKIRSVNPAAERLFGYRADEIIGKPATLLVPADRLDEEPKINDEIRQGQRVAQLETVRQRRDGSRIDVALTVSPIRNRRGEIVGASKFMRDITDHKRVQEMFRLVVEAAPNAILVADQRRIITLVNHRTEDLFGYRRAELLGQPIDLLVPVAFRAAHLGHYQSYLAAPTGRLMGAGREVPGRRKDGSEMPLEIGLASIETSQGKFTLASMIDITDRKQFEDELRRSNAELEQFAYIASHDLQEPLRMVASYTELLGQRYKGKLDDKADKYIFYAVDGAKRMQQLVADLLAYSRVGSQGKPPVPVDTHALVASVVEMLGPAIRKANAKVEISELPPVMADEVQLRQLFQNLIGNALKFRAEADPVIGVRAAHHGERWLFCVEDNGIGIEMQYAARVFQMFQRLHERGKYEGSGIGLAIAKRIVERHGGTIWLESKPGLGTSFFFSLPPVASRPP